MIRPLASGWFYHALLSILFVRPLSLAARRLLRFAGPSSVFRPGTGGWGWGRGRISGRVPFAQPGEGTRSTAPPENGTPETPGAPPVSSIWVHSPKPATEASGRDGHLPASFVIITASPSSFAQCAFLQRLSPLSDQHVTRRFFFSRCCHPADVCHFGAQKLFHLTHRSFRVRHRILTVNDE